MLIRKSFITLVEIMIVIALLSLTAGVVAFNIRGFLKQQRVLDEMGQVAEELRVAQELMVLTGLDSEVRFQSTPDGMTAEIIPKSSIAPLTKPLLKYSKKVFADLDEVIYEDASEDVALKDSFSLTFFSKGFVMNRGVLSLRGGNTVRSIVLPGYPAPIVLIEGGRKYLPNSIETSQWTEQVTLQTGAETKKEMK